MKLRHTLPYVAVGLTMLLLSSCEIERGPLYPHEGLCGVERYKVVKQELIAQSPVFLNYKAGVTKPSDVERYEQLKSDYSELRLMEDMLNRNDSSGKTSLQICPDCKGYGYTAIVPNGEVMLNKANAERLKQDDASCRIRRCSGCRGFGVVMQYEHIAPESDYSPCYTVQFNTPDDVRKREEKEKKKQKNNRFLQQEKTISDKDLNELRDIGKGEETEREQQEKTISDEDLSELQNLY